MYARGSDNNNEFNKGLNSFFRGIVIDDRDPNQMQRVKVYIPELTNLDYNKESNPGLVLMAPHSIGDFSPDLHRHLMEILPWAEQASGLFGERGLSQYKAKGTSQVSKASYVEKKTANTSPNSTQGGGMPRQQIANRDNSGAGSSIDNFAGKNPTAAGYLPINSGPQASGIYGVPQVGSHVWVFFDRGDLNFPVYFASIPSYPETAQVYQNGGYPGNYSTSYGPQGAEDRPPEPRRESNLNREKVTERSDLNNIDPETKRKLYELTQAEVGGQGRDAQVAFMETVANRAAAEGRSIDSIVSDRRYYEPLQKGITRPVNSTTQAKYDSVFEEVASGSNITNGATHNASAGVARRVNAGGYDANVDSVMVIGGETFYNKDFPREQNWLKKHNSTS